MTNTLKCKMLEACIGPRSFSPPCLRIQAELPEIAAIRAHLPRHRWLSPRSIRSRQALPELANLL